MGSKGLSPLCRFLFRWVAEGRLLQYGVPLPSFLAARSRACFGEYVLLSARHAMLSDGIFEKLMTRSAPSQTFCRRSSSEMICGQSAEVHDPTACVSSSVMGSRRALLWTPDTCRSGR